MQLSLIWLLPFILIFSPIVRAIETPTINSSVRALAMGDAFTAVANDDSSLFYNPAGLARVRGLNLKIFDLDAGVSGVTAYKNLTALKGATAGAGFANNIQALYGQHVWTGVGGESIFTMPMFGVGAYDHLSSLIRINNPVYPNLHTRIINDFGYVMGVGVPVAPLVHLGVDLRYIKRTGADSTFGPSFIADLNPATITSNLTGWGTGYGADLGATAILPAPFFTAALSAVWKNIGQIQYRSNNGTVLPTDDNNITLGSSFTFDTPIVSLTPALDFTNINNPDMQLTRKINFGIEINLPLLDIRGGFHEGYYTAGLGVNLGLFRVDAATYGVELGDYPGQIEDRRYALQFTMQIGVGNFSATSDGKKGAGGAGAAAGAGAGRENSSNSIWGGQRLKQRR